MTTDIEETTVTVKKGNAVVSVYKNDADYLIKNDGWILVDDNPESNETTEVLDNG